MKNILAFLEKRFQIIIIALFLISLMQNCSQSSKISKFEKQEKQSLVKIDSLQRNQITKEQLEIILEINSLETARKVVYDNNTIVRTAQRPDDVMNAYDQRIKELKKKLK